MPVPPHPPTEVPKGAGQDAGLAETPAAPAKPTRELHARMFGSLESNPGFLLTIGYLLLTGVGVIYDVLYYGLFGIPILNFSEPGDFFLAGFRRPLLLFLFVASVLTLWRLIVVDRKWRGRSDRYRTLADRMEQSRWYSNWAIYPLIICVYFASLTGLYARYTASEVRAGRGNLVSLDLNTPPVNSLKAGRNPLQLLIGTNSKFLFLYTPVEGKVQVVPIASVSRMMMGAGADATVSATGAPTARKEATPQGAARPQAPKPAPATVK